MRLFTKRNYDYLKDNPSKAEFLSSEARTRLIAQIRYLSSNDKFLEWFILFENEPLNKIYFDRNKIDSFSLAELGYKMSDYFEFEEFKFIELEDTSFNKHEESFPHRYFDDSKLFDLAEILILFSKPKTREEVITRLNDIFNEENTGYQIVERLITNGKNNNLTSYISSIKNRNLANKIKSYYYFDALDDYKSMAKIGAEILNLIFSDESEKGKKKEISKLLNHLSLKLTEDNNISSEKSKRLLEHLDALLNISKNLCNDIYDVRHTEKSTITISNDMFYKLIASLNISLVELVFNSLKDIFLFGEDWEKIKEEYISKYEINRNVRLTIKKPTVRDGEEDIPF